MNGASTVDSLDVDAGQVTLNASTTLRLGGSRWNRRTNGDRTSTVLIGTDAVLQLEENQDEFINFHKFGGEKSDLKDEDGLIIIEGEGELKVTRSAIGVLKGNSLLLNAATYAYRRLFPIRD